MYTDNIISEEEFNRLSMNEQKKYLMGIIDSLSNEEIEELYEEMVDDGIFQGILKETKK